MSDRLRRTIGGLLRRWADLIGGIVGLWRALVSVPQRIVDALDPYASYYRHRAELAELARGVVRAYPSRAEHPSGERS